MFQEPVGEPEEEVEAEDEVSGVEVAHVQEEEAAAVVVVVVGMVVEVEVVADADNGKILGKRCVYPHHLHPICFRF